MQIKLGRFGTFLPLAIVWSAVKLGAALDAVAVDEYGATHFSGGTMPGTVATNEVVIAGGGIKTSGVQIAGGQVIASAVHAAGTITAASATVNGQPVVLDNDPRLAGGGGGGGVRVYVSASCTVGVNPGSDTIPYATEEVDTHNAWSGLTFTAPLEGIYQINATCSPVSGGAGNIYIVKNGLAWGFGGVSGVAQNGTRAVSAAILLQVGETISLKMTAPFSALYARNLENRLTIVRVAP